MLHSLDARICIGLPLETNTRIALLGVLALPFPLRKPFDPLGMLPGQRVVFIAENIDLCRQQSGFVCRVISAFPNLMTACKCIAELLQSSQIVGRSSQEWIMSIV
ncbi:hypothetical protein D3C72_526740 [compost metagenome]